MTPIDPPEFGPDDAPSSGGRRGSASSPEPEADQHDLLRCSRFLDHDLDAEDRRAFEADLARRGDLRQLLAELRAVTAQVRVPVEASDAELDDMMAAVWAQLDDGTAPGKGVAPLQRRRPIPMPSKRRRVWAPLLQLSAAAAVVVAIAFAAVSGDSRDDSGSTDSESASMALEQQRASAEAIDHGISAQVQDAMTASTAFATGYTEGDLGSFTDVAALLGRLRTLATNAAAATTTGASLDGKAAAPPADSALSSPASGEATCTIDPPSPTSQLDSAGVATVAGTPVEWSVWTSEGRQRIIVQDLATCATLADQPI